MSRGGYGEDDEAIDSQARRKCCLLTLHRGGPRGGRRLEFAIGAARTSALRIL